MSAGTSFLLSFYIPYTHAHTGVKEHYFLEKENLKKCLKPIPEQGFWKTKKNTI